jgi:hypothetical protein
MDAELFAKATRYAAQRGVILGRLLGDGIHGIVLEAEYKAKPGRLAIKVHSNAEAFARECAVYRRLAGQGITGIPGFHIPQFLGADDELLVIEMTIVTRPFVLDFASAYLDRPPQFPLDAIAQWEMEKREQFGVRWPIVQTALAELRGLGIHQTDVSPSNIGFRDEAAGE